MFIIYIFVKNLMDSLELFVIVLLVVLLIIRFYVHYLSIGVDVNGQFKWEGFRGGGGGGHGGSGGFRGGSSFGGSGDFDRAGSFDRADNINRAVNVANANRQALLNQYNQNNYDYELDTNQYDNQNNNPNYIYPADYLKLLAMRNNQESEQ